MLQIEKAKIDDIEALMTLFRECTEALLSAGIHQWNGSYPTVAIFQKDIESDSVFVVKENGKMLATITLNDRQDEQYQTIQWKYPSEKVLVIHRLAVSPKSQGRSIGKLLCHFAESFGLENGFAVIRLDAYSDNPVSCGLYEKLDYHRAAGFCWFHGNELPFYCYEKQLKPG